MKYRMTLKDGSVWTLDDDGGVLVDGTRHMVWESPHSTWRVIGFTTRHFSRRIITLDEAARGESLGQGWVHDLDHGTHRMWGSPKTQRVAKVERFDA